METSELIQAIEAYAKRCNVEPKTVTRRAVGNSALYERMTNGGSCTLKVANRLWKFLDEEGDAA